ncbi:hypothetical protein [Natrinema sp. 1APR25-10V2]|uniref:hypothetical protein n=1 Tax=Natrinema sp. 1APR25-10V2 TaxID=2951081 RepID=UPI00287B9ABA|nr:hypothetical protein [Natrinema sp. 1APR25-10V2]
MLEGEFESGIVPVVNSILLVELAVLSPLFNSILTYILYFGVVIAIFVDNDQRILRFKVTK